jgi:hypothetical protein
MAKTASSAVAERPSDHPSAVPTLLFRFSYLGVVMCQCAERRVAIVAGVRALRRGDVAGAVNQAQFIGRSFVDDLRHDPVGLAASARQALLAAARRRLTR